MKYVAVFAVVLLTGCNGWMSHEEFQSRTQWCISHGLEPVTEYITFRDGSHHPNPTNVRCRDQAGNLFQSEYVK